MANIDDAFRIEKLSLNDVILITEGSSDPSTGAGYEAPIGSIFVLSSGPGLYFKVNTGNTNWSKFDIGLPTWLIKTSAYTALNGDNIIADTNSGAFTITLPAAPSAGDMVRIKDSRGMFATNNLTIGRNGNNILAVAQDLIVDISNADLTLVYQDATVGWTI